ncbi:MAG: mechanosensitive ion channel family protein [Steroidobacteraceae bacterium]
MSPWQSLVDDPAREASRAQERAREGPLACGSTGSTSSCCHCCEGHAQAAVSRPEAADLIKILGIGTVGIGFAFQNILQNFLAGILLLLQEPFRLGDLISVAGIEGNVSDIQARATIVTTKEGSEVIIPNATIFTNPVAVGQKNTQQP